MKFHSCFSFCSSFPNSRPAISTISTGEQKHGNLQIFSSRELEIATHDFSSSNKVGEGAFGSVYMGQLKNGSIVAVKVLSVELESMRGEREFISELAALSDIRHENLVKLQGCCVDGANRYLVYDYMENNSLTQTLLGKEQNRMKFSWEARRNISFGVARGLAYIHEEVKPHILHRDIKASNILLDKDFTPKVADFGLSRILRDNTSHVSTRVAGTFFGVLLLEIISGRSAVDFDLELGEHFLVQKAWEAYNENKLLQIIDPILIMNFLEEEEEEDALRFLIVGLLCVQEIAKLRPQMSTCVKMMVNEIDIKDIQICQPGCVSNLMGVKLHHSQTCESSSSSRDATYTMSTRSSVYFK
ncbi:putative serine/threonine-protein kinase isoform X2 [Ricinus communis]|uniref:putative serine/threonine-protein kinase isoform X2 n=1 Tax=Ricinus communis TaxID=3988 RepID=UPI00201AB7A2|nr:putative serine/threonine-protein kinase isoform X2 [Ricinus communis]